MGKGTMILDSESERLNIRFGSEDYYGGSHCGECVNVQMRGRWIPTRIEMGDNLYLAGIQIDQLEGLPVRI